MLQLGVDMRRALLKQLGMTISLGVARNKLLARLVGPQRKPDGLSVLPDAAARAFICEQPIQSIPSLRYPRTFGFLLGPMSHHLSRSARLRMRLNAFSSQTSPFRASAPPGAPRSVDLHPDRKPSSPSEKRELDDFHLCLKHPNQSSPFNWVSSKPLVPFLVASVVLTGTPAHACSCT